MGLTANLACLGLVPGAPELLAHSTFLVTLDSSIDVTSRSFRHSLHFELISYSLFINGNREVHIH